MQIQVIVETPSFLSIVSSRILPALIGVRVTHLEGKVLIPSTPNCRTTAAISQFICFSIPEFYKQCLSRYAHRRLSLTSAATRPTVFGSDSTAARNLPWKSRQRYLIIRFHTFQQVDSHARSTLAPRAPASSQSISPPLVKSFECSSRKRLTKRRYSNPRAFAILAQ